MTYNEIMKELAEYIRIQEEAEKKADELRDMLKKRMSHMGVEVLIGDEHKATFKTFTTSRIDTSALKRDLPDVAAAYTRTSENKRFTFA